VKGSMQRRGKGKNSRTGENGFWVQKGLRWSRTPRFPKGGDQGGGNFNTKSTGQIRTVGKRGKKKMTRYSLNKKGVTERGYKEGWKHKQKGRKHFYTTQPKNG